MKLKELISLLQKIQNLYTEENVGADIVVEYAKDKCAEILTVQADFISDQTVTIVLNN